MKTNLLKALNNIPTSQITDINKLYKSKGKNRANSTGDNLESYIKDLFCDSFGLPEDKKVLKYSQFFSYLGNQNNPPDMIIKNGDALEVKKIEGIRSQIALNSSYPKDTLYANSPMITEECKKCEEWKQKDIIYIVGSAPSGILKSLWFVYGNCFAANKGTYERIKNTISDGITQLENVEFSETNEIGRVNKVDPLGITYLRIRGMWGVENPTKVFDYIPSQINNDTLSVNAVLLEEKYSAFPEKDRKKIEANESFNVEHIKIKSPNNPAKLVKAVLIKLIK